MKPSHGLRYKWVLQSDPRCQSVCHTCHQPFWSERKTKCMDSLFFHLQEKFYLSPRPMTSLLQTVSIRISLSRKESGENALIKELYSCRKAASVSILNYLGTPSRFALPWRSFTLAHKASSTSYSHLSKEQKRLTGQHHLPGVGASALSEGFCGSLCRSLTPARSRGRKFGFFYKTKDQGKKEAFQKQRRWSGGRQGGNCMPLLNINIK